MVSVCPPALVSALAQLIWLKDPHVPEYAYNTSCRLLLMHVTVAVVVVAVNWYQPSREIAPPAQAAAVGSLIVISEIVPVSEVPFTVRAVAAEQLAPCALVLIVENNKMLMALAKKILPREIAV
jgi:putative effector of murein hydrolase